MPGGSYSFRQFLLAPEVTPGTRVVPATAILRGPVEGVDRQDVHVNVDENIAIALGVDRQYVPYVYAQAQVPAMPATFEQAPYFGEAGFNLATPAHDSAGGYAYAYSAPLTAPFPTRRTYSLQMGDDYQMTYGVYGYVETFKLSGKAKEAWMMEGVWGMRQGVDNNYTGVAGHITLDATTGNHINDSDNGLAIFPVGAKVTLSGTASNNKTFTVTTSTANKLTVTETIAPETPAGAVTIKENFSVVALPTVEEILFQQTKLYIDAVDGTLGTTQAALTFLEFSLSVNTGLKAIATGDGNLYFSYPSVDKKALKVTLEVTFEYDGSAIAEIANWINRVARQIRIQALGTAISGGSLYTNKTARIDCAGKWLKFDKIGEQDGNDIVKGTMEVRYDATANLGCNLTFVNNLSALP